MELYIKDGRLSKPSNIVLEIDDKQYIGVNVDTAQKLGYETIDELLASHGWQKYVKKEPSITEARNSKISEIEQYDTSSDVNGFIINGCEFWLSKADRVGLMHLLNVEESLGKETTSLWVYNICVPDVPIARAKRMLELLETYAYECYGTTKMHINDVNTMTDIDKINNYDVTQGYPEKLVFNLGEDA